ncbi:arginine--tRNA ligase [Patescibacteria group bacterium]|nr:arginine--tRNA ligase [Patescibacteria group bacterium]
MKGTDIFKTYKSEVDKAVARVLERIKKEKKTRKYVSFGDYPIEQFRKVVLEVIKEIFSIKLGSQEIKLDQPPIHVAEDFALSTFVLSEKLKKKPGLIAKEIADHINENEIKFLKSAKNVGPYVNIKVDAGELYAEILASIESLREKYGKSDLNKSKVALFDYSAPNIAKPIGVGHLRSTIIGQTLVNLYEATGYATVRANHLGDWGTQFGELIYAYQEWGDEAEIVKDPLVKLKDLYVKFHQKAKDDPELGRMARDIFQKLEREDSGIMTLWKRFRDLSLEGFQKVYDRLGVEFDTNMGESYFVEQAEKEIEECIKKGIAKKDPASELVLVDSLEGVPSFLLRKQDGSTLYLARDLAAIKYRIGTFDPETIVYVVGGEQELHFKQLFKLAKESGIIGSQKVKHVGFGMILSGGKKMSTRGGTLIELEDLISQAVSKSKEMMTGRKLSVVADEIDQVAEIIGIGAIVYNDLRQSRTKNISFDWERMLDLEGSSAVYLQYTCVRINSILRKLKEEFPHDLDGLSDLKAQFGEQIEFEVAKKLMVAPDVIFQAQYADSPHILCEYLEEVARLFSTFYNQTSVIKTSDPELRRSRIMLIKSVLSVLKNGLTILNIKTPKRM